MNKIRRYEVEGIVLEIPLYFDEQAKMYIEDYPDFKENPIWTKKGHRIVFTGEDACEWAEKETRGDFLDCGSCKYYKKAAANTWFGICKHKKNSINSLSKKEDR